MLDYPSARYADLTELYARFNKNFRLRDYNDDYADYLIEKGIRKNLICAQPKKNMMT
jgi:hypothetical protein